MVEHLKDGTTLFKRNIPEHQLFYFVCVELFISNNKYFESNKKMYVKFKFKNQTNFMYFFGFICMDNDKFKCLW